MGTDSDRKSFGDTSSDGSKQVGNSSSLKTWVTPKVITSSLEDTENGGAATGDVTVAS